MIELLPIGILIEPLVPKGLDLMEGLSFYPLSEVVGDCEHVHELAGCYRKLSHYVHPPLHEGPWREDGSELLGWQV